MSSAASEEERLARLQARQRRIAWAIIAGMLLYGLCAITLDRIGRGRTVDGKYDAVVVAGARVWSDGEPSLTLLRRTRGGIELWKAGVAPVLVTTGGVGRHPPAEARVAADLAKRAGVPPTALIVEDRSRTTEQNARFTRELIGDKRVVVVTDAYHVLRSQMIYDRHFSDATVVGVDIGWRPPVRESLREVAALSWYSIERLFATMSGAS